MNTIFGEGSILSFLPASASAAPRYRVKTSFGIGLLCPSAVLHAIPTKDTPYVRRDGIMVRDESSLNDEDSLDTDKLDKKFKLLFGTESIYLFLRLYNLLCLLLSDSLMDCQTAKDPATLYHNPQRKGSENGSSQRLDVAGVCRAVKKVLRKEMTFRDYVSFCRKVCREKVHQFAVLPKLIEKCSNYLIKVAKEDALLQVYDYCQFSEVDPVAVRSQCLAVVPEAIYRIQYDTEAKSLFYGYLPQTEPLLSNPRGDETEEDVHGDVVEDPMEEDDPIEPFEEDAGPPVAKRVRLK